MAKRVVFSKKAYADIDRIVEFNNQRNRSDTYSKKFVRNLNKRLQLLCKHPLISSITDEPGQLLFIWDSCYIFYVDYDVDIEITSIYHHKENITR